MSDHNNQVAPPPQMAILNRELDASPSTGKRLASPLRQRPRRRPPRLRQQRTVKTRTSDVGSWLWQRHLVSGSHGPRYEPETGHKQLFHPPEKGSV